MVRIPGAISGRWFAVGFAIVLVLGVVIGFSVVVRFQKIMTTLDEVRRLWPHASAMLEDRYQQVDLVLENLENLEADSKEERTFNPNEWQRIRNEFKASTLYDVQVRLIPELETMAANHLKTIGNSKAFDPMRKSIVDFVQADRHLEGLQSDFIGWLCMRLLALNIPDRIYSLLE